MTSGRVRACSCYNNNKKPQVKTIDLKIPEILTKEKRFPDQNLHIQSNTIIKCVNSCVYLCSYIIIAKRSLRSPKTHYNVVINLNTCLGIYLWSDDIVNIKSEGIFSNYNFSLTNLTLSEIFYNFITIKCVSYH